MLLPRRVLFYGCGCLGVVQSAIAVAVVVLGLLWGPLKLSPLDPNMLSGNAGGLKFLIQQLSKSRLKPSGIEQNGIPCHHRRIKAQSLQEFWLGKEQFHQSFTKPDYTNCTSPINVFNITQNPIYIYQLKKTVYLLLTTPPPIVWLFVGKGGGIGKG